MKFGRFIIITLIAAVAIGGIILAYPSFTRDAPIQVETPAGQTEPSPVIRQAEDVDLTPDEEPTSIQAKLAIAGDIVPHMPLNSQALDEQTGVYNYLEILGGSLDWVGRADYAACTMETTFPGTGIYSGYPAFSSPHDLADSLRQAGFDLIFTASNHCMDMDKPGLNSTLDVLDEAGLAHVGTYRTQEEFDQHHGVHFADVGGIRVAFINYTYGTNGIPVTTCPYAVNLFVTDYLTDLVDVDYDHINASLAAARAGGADIIAAMMHWGNEYHTAPNFVQEAVADHLMAQGVDLVLGGHPHVPQPMEERIITGVDGTQRTGYIVYSLGNYISCQKDQYTNLTAVLDITLERDGATGRAWVSDVQYAPMLMMDAELYDMPASPRYTLLDIHAQLDAWEAGNSGITESLYNALRTGLDDLHSILGPQWDYRSGL